MSDDQEARDIIRGADAKANEIAASFLRQQKAEQDAILRARVEAMTLEECDHLCGVLMRAQNVHYAHEAVLRALKVTP